MRRICCVCSILFGLKAPYDDESETHGYCDECFDVEMRKLAILAKDKQSDFVTFKEV